MISGSVPNLWSLILSWSISFIKYNSQEIGGDSTSVKMLVLHSANPDLIPGTNYELWQE